jgi:hypothetical protein
MMCGSHGAAWYVQRARQLSVVETIEALEGDENPACFSHAEGERLEKATGLEG